MNPITYKCRTPDCDNKVERTIYTKRPRCYECRLASIRIRRRLNYIEKHHITKEGTVDEKRRLRENLKNLTS